LEAVLIAVASNLDNLTVGIALGMRPRPVSVLANLVIAAVTMIGTAAAMVLGDTLSTICPSPRHNCSAG
jgi:putative Mn2+ efflux pump MntP